MINADTITQLAEVEMNGVKTRFGIKEKDRTRHIYAIGKEGFGKSTLLKNIAKQDIKNGRQLIFIDPNGVSTEELAKDIHDGDLEVFHPFNIDGDGSFNVLDWVPEEDREFITTEILSAFEKIWGESWSVHIYHSLYQAISALLQYDSASFNDIARIFKDEQFRRDVLMKIENDSVKEFWEQDFLKSEIIKNTTGEILDKLTEILSSEKASQLAVQKNSSIKIAEIIDGKKTFLINLKCEDIDSGFKRLIGSVLLAKIYKHISLRADLGSGMLADAGSINLIIDDFDLVAGKSFAKLIAEARSYKMSLCIAHRYVEQIDDILRSVIFANIGTLIAFRLGAFDAKIFEKDFAPDVSAEDMGSLDRGEVYLKLSIDGVSSKAFYARIVEKFQVQIPRIPQKQQQIKQYPEKTMFVNTTQNVQISEVRPSKLEEKHVQNQTQEQNEVLAVREENNPFKKAFAEADIDKYNPTGLVVDEPEAEYMSLNSLILRRKPPKDEVSENKKKLQEVISAYGKTSPDHQNTHLDLRGPSGVDGKVNVGEKPKQDEIAKDILEKILKQDDER